MDLLKNKCKYCGHHVSYGEGVYSKGKEIHIICIQARKAKRKGKNK